MSLVGISLKQHVFTLMELWTAAQARVDGF